jgi:hypothetical protein
MALTVKSSISGNLCDQDTSESMLLIPVHSKKNLKKLSNKNSANVKQKYKEPNVIETDLESSEQIR